MMRRSCCSCFVLAAVLSAVFGLESDAGPAAAPNFENPPDVSAWDKISLYGDLRLRYELDYDSVRGDGVTAREDRNRFRTRARAGLKFEPNDAWLFDVRVRHGNTDSQQSPHVTWAQDSGDEGPQTDFTVDRLYLAWRGDKMGARLGRTGLPFWKPHEMLWDDDVYIDGASVSFSAGAIKLHAGAWYLPDGEDNHDYDERSGLFGGQAVFTKEVGDKGTLTVADGLLFVTDRSGVANGVNDDTDHAINALDVQFRTERFGLPLTVGADYYHNFEDGPAGDPLAGATDGFVVFAKVGDLKKQGDFQVGYYYADIEKYAVARFFAQDDWHRFGSAAQTRSSDFSGHEIRVGYAFSERVNLLARAYFVETLSNAEDGNRFRLDLNVKF